MNWEFAALAILAAALISGFLWYERTAGCVTCGQSGLACGRRQVRQLQLGGRRQHSTWRTHLRPRRVVCCRLRRVIQPI